MNSKISSMLALCIWTSSAVSMHTLPKIKPSLVKLATQCRGVLSYNANDYLEKTKREHIRTTKIRLGSIIEQAHALMLEPIKHEELRQEKIYTLPHTMLEYALSMGQSLHDHHSTWLWPSEIEELLDILHHGRATIYGLDARRKRVKTVHSWNFPLHTLCATLNHYQYDARINEDKELADAYADQIRRVEQLCDKRFNNTRDLFNVKTAIQACQAYHTHIAQLKKLDE